MGEPRALYRLLGVAPDAATDDIRWAYERQLNRALRDGATRHAEELVQAWETLSDPKRRAVYDRHGLLPVRERSPGAAPLPPPGRYATRPGSPGVNRPGARASRPGAASRPGPPGTSPVGGGRRRGARWPFVLLAGVGLGALLMLLALAYGPQVRAAAEGLVGVVALPVAAAATPAVPLAAG